MSIAKVQPHLEIMQRSFDTAPARPTRVETLLPGRLLRITGPISTRSSGSVRTALREAIDEGRGDVLVNLAGAQVWDATGLGVLVGAHHRARRCGRRLVVVDPSPRMRSLLTTTKLDRVLAVAAGAVLTQTA